MAQRKQTVWGAQEASTNIFCLSRRPQQKYPTFPTAHNLKINMLPDRRLADYFTGRLLEILVPPEVDKEAFHLLKLLLDMNTRHRLAAPQALDHAFLRDCPRLPTAAASPEHGAAAAETSIGNLDEEGAVDFR